MKLRTLVRRSIWALVVVFFIMNVVSFFHAYKFTHFSDGHGRKSNRPESLSLTDKVKILLTGIDNPKPASTEYPKHPFETIHLQSNKMIECWKINVTGAKGTVVLFHGYGARKSGMLDKSEEFIKQGYNTILVDFMGAGGSEGYQTTLGFKEAIQVKTVVDYVTQQGDKIYLFGTSMGAVAIMKAIHDYKIKPEAIIIECPFGSMYETTCARFRSMNMPVFPMAGLLVFWGGIQNGFWAFGHNPVEYAKSITCPTLLLYGEKDERVSREEIDEIYAALRGEKKLKTYPLAGHENYLAKYKEEWIADVQRVLQ